VVVVLEDGLDEVPAPSSSSPQAPTSNAIVTATTPINPRLRCKRLMPSV
jgi:hypothetical protein